MSSQRGNANRTRPQKHKNKNAFKNNLHETNKKALAINGLEVIGCCARCTEIIQWKIQYKKYKPLTVPKKCVKCLQPRTVKHAYHIVCRPCAKKHRTCAKCSKPSDVVGQISLEGSAAGSKEDISESGQKTRQEDEEPVKPDMACGQESPPDSDGDVESDSCSDGEEEDLENTGVERRKEQTQDVENS